MFLKSTHNTQVQEWQKRIMLQSEFEKLTGQRISSQDYVKVEKAYMAIGDDIDKETFCKMWMNKEELADIMTSRAIEYKEQKEQYGRKLNAQIDRFANFLILQAEEYDSIDLRAKAIELIGIEEYLRRKISKGYNLWEQDRTLLLELLAK